MYSYFCSSNLSFSKNFLADAITDKRTPKPTPIRVFAPPFFALGKDLKSVTAFIAFFPNDDSFIYLKHLEAASLTPEKKPYCCQKIDISARNLSGIELGHYFPKAETLEKISKALNVTIEKIFANDHIKNKKELIKEINIYLDKLEQNKIEYVYKIVKFLNFG